MRTTGGIFLFLPCVLFAAAREPKPCPTPVEYPYTSLDLKYSSRQKFSHKEKVYYRCAEDFTPSRGVPIVQCVDGAWTKLTLKCDKRSCGNAGDLLKGYFNYEGSSFIGERVQAVCNEGYTLKGPEYRICKRSGWTGGFPTCEVAQVTCSPPVVTNSVSSRDVSVYQLGESVNITCSQGFQLDGAQRITCGQDGQWQPKPPRCQTRLPDKEADGCGVPDNKNSNAKLAEKYITKTSFSSGERVHYVCDIGYNMAGGSRYRRCSKGKWSPLRLKCELQSCGSAGEIIHGQFEYTGAEFGDIATAVCDDGYNLVGRAQRHCMSGGWDGRIPVCEAAVCEAPPPVENADITSPWEEVYTYRTVISYQCQKGVLIGQKDIWCTESGAWSHPPPTCKEITCPPLNVPNASWTNSLKAVYHPRDFLSIQCSPGYMMYGPNTLTCGVDGRWLPFFPECKRRSRYSSRRG
ncbi:complement receptor type 1-like isoform X1 [Xyrichtys novacula]|uniref:Complement receptor type 1-like isoform X1 n=1 Tax=Xyrichtys novacula TaxID=13765 RepID=A0AAV1HH01_XYRNO|nr:complement receptor type 1-like isoform X1 [Xyrichtys novacula]